MTRIQTLLLLSTLAIVAASCQSGKTDSLPDTESTAVAYEPAYPEDVSAESLTEEDVAQHEAAHSHGEGEPSHGDGEHSHGDGEDHGDHVH